MYLLRRGTRFDGTLHLMPHHIVFSYLPSRPADAPPDAKPPRQKEVWITYPMINYCCLKSCPPVMRQQPSIRIRCRDFTFFAFFFPDEKKARDVYDSIRALSCKIGRLDKLLAFSYQPKPPEDQFNSWDIYDARREFKRLGISPKDTEKGWRISEINVEYKVSRPRSSETAGRSMLTNSAVLEDIPCPYCRTFESIRQCSPLRRCIPFEATHTRARLPPSTQQLFYNPKLTTYTRYHREP